MCPTLPYKIRTVFAHELKYLAETGKFPPKLYAFMLVVRSLLTLDTQEIEGMNSIVQQMCRSAPHMQVMRASDRLALKKGDLITAQECCDMHGAIIKYMNTDDFMNRFAPLSTVGTPAQHPDPPSWCEHSELSVAAVPFAAGFSHRFLHDKQCFGAARIFYFERLDRVDFVAPVRIPAFMCAWSYYQCIFVAAGIVDGCTGPTFGFLLPLVISSVLKTLSTQGPVIAPGRKEITVYSYEVRFDKESLNRCSIRLASQKINRVKARRVRKKAKPPEGPDARPDSEPAAPAPMPDANADEEHGDEVGSEIEDPRVLEQMFNE